MWLVNWTSYYHSDLSLMMFTLDILDYPMFSLLLQYTVHHWHCAEPVDGDSDLSIKQNSIVAKCISTDFSTLARPPESGWVTIHDAKYRYRVSR